LADWLGADAGDYRDLLIATLRLTLTGEFRRLHAAVSGLLDFVPRIDAELLDRVIAITEGNEWSTCCSRPWRPRPPTSASSRR
jgi:hypothetical protein